MTAPTLDKRRGRTRFARLWLTAAVLSLFASGCDKDLSRDYEFLVRVSSEPGRALEGAGATLKGQRLGVSDSSGAIAIHLRGLEGDVATIALDCPEGHRPPPPLLVPLRQVGAGVRPEFSAVCTPLTHSIVIALRAASGPHLPVLHLGRELARTDASGAAHLLLDVASEEVLELVLDTSEQPRLRPKSPIVRIQPGSGDSIAAVTREFTVAPQPVARKVSAPRGPTRIE